MSAALFLGGLGLGAVGSLTGVVLPARARGPVAAVLTAGACIAGFVAAARVLASGVTVTASSAQILPLTGVTLSLDPLGAVFVITAAVTGAAASCYAVGYAAPGGSRAATALLPLFITSLLAVPAAASVATFMAAWELMALSSLLLLLTGHRRAEARDAAQWYAVMTHAGAAAILLALVLIGAHAGGQSFAAIRASAGAIPPAGPLPRVRARPGRVRVEGRGGPGARVAAARPSRGAEPGVRADVRGHGEPRRLRHRPDGRRPAGRGQLWWWLAVAGLGVASALFGAIHAAASPDLKRLLAYSTVDNMGLVLIGVGASGALAVTGYHVARPPWP